MTQQEIHHITLTPEPSGRFQPTGFADLGAALYDQPRPDGEPVKMLLVESVQSLANHLEGTAWNSLEDQPVEAMAGLPWVKVRGKSGEYLTSSRTEAHRLASAFIRNSTLQADDFLDLLEEQFGLLQDRPVNRTQLARAIFRLDPINLIHGVFFAVKKWPHQPKVTRAITAFIEAEDVREVHSGGVKTDDVRRRTSGTSAGSAEGYGMVPFHRVEYTAARTQLHVAIDVGLLNSYGLSEEATQLLDKVARWEVATLLSGQLRLRTACSFRLAESPPATFSNPSALARDIADLAGKCPELEDVDPVIEVVWNPKGKA